MTDQRDDWPAGELEGDDGVAAIAAAESRPWTGGWGDDGPDMPDDVDRECAGFPANDYGNGQRLRARFGDRLRWVDEIGWHVWTGTHWDRERGGQQAHLWAHDTAERVRREAVALDQAGPWHGESEKDFLDRVAARRRWAVGSGNKGRVEAMLSEARPYLTIAPADLDADPFRISCRNGTIVASRADDGSAVIDFRPHDPADLMTKCMAVDYDPAARAPAWERFLAQCLPDADKRDWLQSWEGYCLTGDMSEQVLLVLTGSGSNGKSTYVDTLQRMRGGYGATVPIATLMARDRQRGDAATPDLAKLPGVRQAVAHEAEAGDRLAEGLIKMVTGGDVIPVRRLYRDFFDFQPVFKLALVANEAPFVRGTDDGIWRRLVRMDWTQKFVSARERSRYPDAPPKDPTLRGKLWAERSGILNWCLAGLRVWLEEGLRYPDSMVREAETYRDEMDPTAMWQRQQVREQLGGSVGAAALYTDYENWCIGNSVRPMSVTAFGRIMGRRLTKGRDGQGRIVYHDIRVLTPSEAATGVDWEQM